MNSKNFCISNFFHNNNKTFFDRNLENKSHCIFIFKKNGGMDKQDLLGVGFI